MTLTQWRAMTEEQRDRWVYDPESEVVDCGVCGGLHPDLPDVDCRAFYPVTGVSHV